MQTILIPHIDPTKQGATEHVDAIVAALKGKTGLTIESPVTDENFAGRVKEIKETHGKKAHYIVVTGDYGGAKSGEFKTELGNHTQVLMSSYTAAQDSVMGALHNGSIDYLAVPAHAIEPQVLSIADQQVIRRNHNKIIPMTAVPHLLTQASLAAKHTEWDKAVDEGKVQALPDPDATKKFVGIVIPGDVEDEHDKPKFFTQADARKLASAIAQQIGNDSNITVMVTNGPRTFKYNPDEKDQLVINTERMNSIADNKVTAAFIDELEKSGINKDRIILGCIEKGKTPPQGFLAFYDVLNQQAQAGGKATLFIDGVSTTMMAQAANVLAPGVDIIACDTPAKNPTHIAAVNDLSHRKHIDAQLALQNDGHYQLTSRTTHERKGFDDAALVAGKLEELSQSRLTRMAHQAKDTAQRTFGKFTSLVSGNQNVAQAGR